MVSNLEKFLASCLKGEMKISFAYCCLMHFWKSPVLRNGFEPKSNRKSFRMLYWPRFMLLYQSIRSVLYNDILFVVHGRRHLKVWYCEWFGKELWLGGDWGGGRDRDSAKNRVGDRIPKVGIRVLLKEIRRSGVKLKKF